MDLCWIRYTAKPTYNHHYPTSLYEGGHQHTNMRKMFSITKYIQIYLTPGRWKKCSQHVNNEKIYDHNISKKKTYTKTKLRKEKCWGNIEILQSGRLRFSSLNIRFHLTVWSRLLHKVHFQNTIKTTNEKNSDKTYLATLFSLDFKP